MKEKKSKPEPLPADQRRIIDLELGKVKPANAQEQALLDEMNELKRQGIMPYLPEE